MADKKIRRGIELYIDGKKVENDIRSVEAAARKLTKEIKAMTVGSKEYIATQKKLKECNAILAEHRAGLREIKEEQKSLVDKTAEWLGKYGALFATISAGLAGVLMTYNKFRTKLMEREETKADVKALTGLDDESVAWLEKTAQEMSTAMDENGVRIRQSATEILDAFKLVGSAKPELLQNKEALAEVTKQALVLAQAAGMDLKSAVDAVTLSMNQYGAAADQAARYANVMAAGSKYGAAAVESVTIAMTKSGVAASTANVKVEELVGSIEALAEKGIKDQVAGTGLKTFFLKLEAGAKETRPSVVGLQTALETLQKQNLDASEMTKRFGLEAYTVAQAMISSADKVKYYTEAVTGTATANEQAAIKSATAAAKMEQAKNEMAEAGMVIAQQLQPLFSSMVGHTSRFIKALPQVISLLAKLKTTFLAIATVMAAVLIVEKGEIAIKQLQVFWNEKVLVSCKKMYAVIAAHPFAALFIAVAAMVDIYKSMTTQMDKAAKKQKMLNEVNDAAKKNMSQEKDEILGLLSIARDMNKSYDERQTALKKLIEIDKDYFGELTLEKIQTEEVTTAVNKYIERLLMAEKIKQLAAKKEQVQGDIDELWRNGAEHTMEDKGKHLVASLMAGFADLFGASHGDWADSVLHDYLHKTGNLVQEKTEELRMLDDELNKVREDMVRAETETGSSSSSGSSSSTGTVEKESEKKKRLREALAQVDAEYDAKAAKAKAQYIKGEIATEEDYTATLQAIEMARLNAKLQVAGLEESKRMELADRLMDLEVNLRKKIDNMTRSSSKASNQQKLAELDEQLQAQTAFLQSAYEMGIIPTQEKLDGYLLALQGRFNDEKKALLEKIADEELAVIDNNQESELANLREQKSMMLLTEEEYEMEVLRIRERYNAKREDVANKSKEAEARVARETSDTVVAINVATNNKVIEMKKQMMEAVESFGQELGASIADIFTDEQDAWKEFAKSFLKTAIDMVERYVEVSYVGTLAGDIMKSGWAGFATAALKMAAIKTAFAAAKGLVDNWWTGGFTPEGAWDQPQGIVHSNEFVANRFATANPQVLPVLNLIDAAQRSGSISNLSGEDIAAVASASAPARAASAITGTAAYSADTRLLGAITRLEKVMTQAQKAYETPSPAYCFINGKGGINEAEKLNDLILQNAKIK